MTYLALQWARQRGDRSVGPGDSSDSAGCSLDARQTERPRPTFKQVAAMAVLLTTAAGCQESTSQRLASSNACSAWVANRAQAAGTQGEIGHRGYDLIATSNPADCAAYVPRFSFAQAFGN
jgi:hypothetical protein